MKITVLGATGGTGQHVVRRAIAAGHHVTAVVRDPARLPVDADPRLEIVVANALDPNDLAAAVTGRDVVVDTLGPRGAEDATVCSRSWLARAPSGAYRIGRPVARAISRGGGELRRA